MRGSGTGLGIVFGAMAGLLVAVLFLPAPAMPVGLIVGAGVGLAFGAAWDVRPQPPPHDEE